MPDLPAAIMRWVQEYIEQRLRAAGVRDSSIDGGYVRGPLPAASLTSHDHTSASDGGKLSGAIVDSYMEFEDTTTPATPGANKGRIFYDNDLFKAVDDLGNVVTLSGSGGTGAATIYTSVYASPPASPAGGDLWLPSDGIALYRYTGSAWVPWGPIYPLAGIANRPTTWGNQGTATETVTSGGAYLDAPAAGAYSNRRRLKTPPTPPWTITACMLPNLINHSGMWTGLTWVLASSGASVNFGYTYQGNFQVWKDSSATGFSADYVAAIGKPILGPLWMRIGDDGTNRTCEYSADGQHWVLFHSVGRTDFITADQVGWFVNNGSGTYRAGCTLLSWKETP